LQPIREAGASGLRSSTSNGGHVVQSGASKAPVAPAQAYHTYHVAWCPCCQAKAVDVFAAQLAGCVAAETAGRQELRRTQYAELRAAIDATRPSAACRELLKQLKDAERTARNHLERDTYYLFESLGYLWGQLRRDGLCSPDTWKSSSGSLAPKSSSRFLVPAVKHGHEPDGGRMVLDTAALARTARALARAASKSTVEDSVEVVHEIRKWEVEAAAFFSQAFCELMEDETRERHDTTVAWLNATARLVQQSKAGESTASKAMKKRTDVERARHFAKVVGSDIIAAGRDAIAREEANAWMLLLGEERQSLTAALTLSIHQRVKELVGRERAGRERVAERHGKGFAVIQQERLETREEDARLALSAAEGRARGVLAELLERVPPVELLSPVAVEWVASAVASEVVNAALDDTLLDRLSSALVADVVNAAMTARLAEFQNEATHAAACADK
jgi:hypothetical protein